MKNQNFVLNYIKLENLTNKSLTKLSLKNIKTILPTPKAITNLFIDWTLNGLLILRQLFSNQVNALIEDFCYIMFVLNHIPILIFAIKNSQPCVGINLVMLMKDNPNGGRSNGLITYLKIICCIFYICFQFLLVQQIYNRC